MKGERKGQCKIIDQISSSEVQQMQHDFYDSEAGNFQHALKVIQKQSLFF